MVIFRKLTDEEILQEASGMAIRSNENIYVYRFENRTEIKASCMCADVGADWCGKVIGNKIQHVLPIENSRGR